MSKLYSIGKFSFLTGVSKQTLRRMHANGELIPEHISDGGTRYYSKDQLNFFKSEENKHLENKHVVQGLKDLKELLSSQNPKFLTFSTEYYVLDWEEIKEKIDDWKKENKDLTVIDSKDSPYLVNTVNYTFEEILDKAIELLSK